MVYANPYTTNSLSLSLVRVALIEIWISNILLHYGFAKLVSCKIVPMLVVQCTK